MGSVRKTEQVLLISAICYRETDIKTKVLEDLISFFGPIESISSDFDFSHTNYYRTEMGSELSKFFVSFVQYIHPDDLPDIKITSNAIEERYSTDGQRTVNIDPGYIEKPKLVLATTKNFGHRIYIGKGIYGDVQLYWQHGQFKSNPWTYPDYKDTVAMTFFTKERMSYLEQFQKAANGN